MALAVLLELVTLNKNEGNSGEKSDELGRWERAMSIAMRLMYHYLFLDPRLSTYAFVLGYWTRSRGGELRSNVGELGAL